MMDPVTAPVSANRLRLLESYAQILRETGQAPVSIYRFTAALGLSEGDFFREFASFEVLESQLWAGWLADVITSLEGGPEWATFTARQRMLSFYFAWFERSLEIRSLLLLRFSHLGLLKNPAWLRGFRGEFERFCQKTLSVGLASGEIAARGRFSRLYPDAFYVSFRSLISFYLRDESAAFERTDAMIEKSTTLAFELIRTQAVDSAFDLLRFLLPEMRR